jgi:rare lipoprotein A
MRNFQGRPPSLKEQAFAAIALHCPAALLPGRGARFFTMYRSALLAAALLSIAHAAKSESGLASYYGGHGHQGEMTCAHRTRPLGSIVTVTHASHSIQCRVNDRGPFVRGRVIDVSISAAHALGMMRAGVVRVSVQ